MTQQTAMHVRRTAAGFSLLEMLLVLVLIATAMTLAAAAFTDGLRGARLHAAARDVVAQLRFTRALAISRGAPQEFVLDVRRRTWQGPNGRHGQLPDIGELVFQGARRDQFDPQTQAAGQGVVRFFPDGAATGGRLRLQVAGSGWQIDVAWLTGEVRLRRIGAGT
jgi:general secretion pathway protein H